MWEVMGVNEPLGAQRTRVADLDSLGEQGHSSAGDRAYCVADHRSSDETARLPLPKMLIAWLDRVTRGNAAALQLLASYLFVGGVSALVNLVVFNVVYTRLAAPLASNIRWIAAFAAAAQVATIVNFVLNDRLTFHRLPGHARVWWVRCLRFHSTAALGIFVTLVASFALHYWLGIAALLAEGIAILMSLVLNLTMHHVWTYRRT